MSLSVGAQVGAWRVVEATAPGLVLEAPKDEQRRLALKRAVTVLGSAALAVVLAFDEHTRGLEGLTWPFAGLLLVVALVGLASTVASARRWLGGVRLGVVGGEVLGTALPRGALDDFRSGRVRAPPSSVARVVLRRWADGPRVRLALEVELKDGRRLQGPDLECLEAEQAEARAELAPAGEALAGALGLRLQDA